MKKIKRCLLIFCVFLVVAASALPSSAVNEMIDTESESESVSEEESTIVFAQNGLFGTQAASVSEWNPTGFDVNKIDVDSFPDNVKKVLNSSSSFVLLIVREDVFHIWVADCCALGVGSIYGTFAIVDLSRTSLESSYPTNEYIYPKNKDKFDVEPKYKTCYYASYSWSATSSLYSFLETKWKVADSKSFVLYRGTTALTGLSVVRYEVPRSLTKDAKCWALVYGNFSNYSPLGNATYAFDVKNAKFSMPDYSSYPVPISLSYFQQYFEEAGAKLFTIGYGGAFPTTSSQQNASQQSILDNLKSLPSKIKGFFTALGDRLGDFFTALGDRLKGFFETLENRLLWFSDDGSASYTNPFDNLLDDVKTKINGYITDVENFNATLNDTLSSVVSYVEQGSGAIQLFLTGVPLVSAFLLFFVVFAVVRKVVGR